MLYSLFEYLSKHYDLPGAGLWRFISFRALLAIIISLTISMIYGARIIRYLQKQQIGETVRDLGLEGQLSKKGTPTMGGVIIILATLVPVLLLARLDNVYILLMIVSMSWMAIIGFTDDYIKVFKKDKKGLKGIFKVIGQIGLGLIISITMLKSDEIVLRLNPQVAKDNHYKIVKLAVPNARTSKIDTILCMKAPITNVPFMKGNELDYGKIGSFFGDKSGFLGKILFILMVILVVTAVSNGANLTDGLDGLATGVSAVVVFALGILCYLSGNLIAAKYLNIFYIPNVGELVIFSACLLGACIGFLWHNTFPARVFMGDTGSLMLGGIIAAMAIVIRKELLIPVLCGVFLIENLSVIIQVSYFKYTKKKYGEGRRVFLMSPLHHHYQKKGLHETTISVRFWIVQILLVAVAILTLKIR
jgi:phospho-N-acetylmuramoyl-pentapeptide-transferase